MMVSACTLLEKGDDVHQRKIFVVDTYSSAFSSIDSSRKELVVIQEPSISCDKILRTVSTSVAVTACLKSFLLEYLLPTMYKEGGIGIAAVQVALPIRALIMDIPYVTHIDDTPILPINTDPRYVRKAVEAGRTVKVVESIPVFEITTNGDIVCQQTCSERLVGAAVENHHSAAMSPDVVVRLERKPVFMINPIIEYVSDNTVVIEEGCLSVPRDYIQRDFGDDTRVERPNGVSVRYTDEYGEEQKLSVDGCDGEHEKWMVRCVLHEMDHLQGVLFTDKLYCHGEAMKKATIESSK